MRQLPDDWLPAMWENYKPGIDEFLHDIAFWCALIAFAALILYFWSYT